MILDTCCGESVIVLQGVRRLQWPYIDRDYVMSLDIGENITIIHCLV